MCWLYSKSFGRTFEKTVKKKKWQYAASTFFKLLNWNRINDHFMSSADKSPMSYIRFGAVQLGQRGRSQQPLPLAERLHSSLVGSRGATGQRLGADCQLPWCIWSVCGWKVWFWLWTVLHYALSPYFNSWHASCVNYWYLCIVTLWLPRSQYT